MKKMLHPKSTSINAFREQRLNESLSDCKGIVIRTAFELQQRSKVWESFWPWYFIERLSIFIVFIYISDKCTTKNMLCG